VDRHIDRFARANAGIPIRSITRGDIIRARDEFADVPGEAANWLKAMRALFAYALDIEEIKVDPTARVAKLAPAHREGFRTWSEDEIDIYLGCHRPPTIAHTTFVLALYTGAARADLVRLGPANVRDGVLHYRRVKTAKTGGPLISVPILPPLAAVLDTLPGDRTFLATREGRDRSALALTGDMAAWVAAVPAIAGEDHLGRRLTLHGLRKALGRRLAEAGCDARQIMSILGHRSVSSAEVYTRAYDRATSAADGMAKLGKPVPSKVRRLKR
jgi:integrase